MEEEINLIELFNILKKRLGMIVALGFTGFILFFIFTFFFTTPEYNSVTQMLVRETETEIEVDGIIQENDVNRNLQLINTYSDIIKGPATLNQVRTKLNLDLSYTQLSEKIKLTTDANSRVISLQVTDSDPNEAAKIANTVAEVFQNNISTLLNEEKVEIINEANANMDPVSQNKVLNMTIGLVIGLMVGVGLTFLLEFLDNTIKDEKFVTEELGWINLGSITEMTEEELKLEVDVPQRENESRNSHTQV